MLIDTITSLKKLKHLQLGAISQYVQMQALEKILGIRGLEFFDARLEIPSFNMNPEIIKKKQNLEKLISYVCCLNPSLDVNNLCHVFFENGKASYDMVWKASEKVLPPMYEEV